MLELLASFDLGVYQVPEILNGDDTLEPVSHHTAWLFSFFDRVLQALALRLFIRCRLN